MFNYFVSPATRKYGHQAARLLIGLCFSISASAQISPAQERDIGIRNQQELQRQQQQEQQQRQQLERAPDVRPTTPEKATSQKLPTETPCFLIQHLQLQNGSGVPLPEFGWVLEQLTAADAPIFIGQCVGAQGVALLIERTQKILVDRGFVTSRVLASQQDMSQSTLALTLIPGRIRAIRLAEPVDPRANLSNVLPMQAGDILNLRDIEQALENLKRVPTAEADIQIEPAQGDGA
jgi:hemolysin activation/secretion protein